MIPWLWLLKVHLEEALWYLNFEVPVLDTDKAGRHRRYLERPHQASLPPPGDFLVASSSCVFFIAPFTCSPILLLLSFDRFAISASYSEIIADLYYKKQHSEQSYVLSLGFSQCWDCAKDLLRLATLPGSAPWKSTLWRFGGLLSGRSGGSHPASLQAFNPDS